MWPDARPAGPICLSVSRGSSGPAVCTGGGRPAIAKSPPIDERRPDERPEEPVEERPDEPAAASRSRRLPWLRLSWRSAECLLRQSSLQKLAEGRGESSALGRADSRCAAEATAAAVVAT